MNIKILPKSRADSVRRIVALTRKETWQILRDPSAIAIGIVLPLVLLILFGYGLSFDIKHLPVALVVEHSSDESSGATAGFRLSPYFSAQQVGTMAEAEKLMAKGKARAVVRFLPHFARDAALEEASVQVTVNATDSNTARIGISYAQGAIATWLARDQAEGQPITQGADVSIESRMWFNDANESTWFLVPGLIVLVMTLIGALLTSLVIAREWERGTFEALFATPVRPGEILLSKTVPYFVMGMIGLALSVIGSQVLFGVPLRGSLWLLVLVSSLYLLVALGIGLVISSATKSQFLANQITFLVTFLPATMLSGFIFDIRSMPLGPQIVTKIFPARYFVSSLQTLFLAGDVWAVILPDCAILTGMAALLMTMAIRMTRKRIG
ncbi:MAG TPA: ABC transporter permease [Candidatus Sulfotelmatobacter sp.]|jgi:ABC-2 type transport system permease protein|nr:ABC transporter permease [Candidatus Sulfotelmatobacter sp.]